MDKGLFVVVTAYSSINHDKRPIYPSTAHFHHKWREKKHTLLPQKARCEE